MFDNAVSTFVTILGITVAAAFVVAYFTVQVKRFRDETLRKTNEDLKERVDVLEDENRLLKSTVEDLRNQVVALHQVVTAAAAIAELRNDLLSVFERHESNAASRHQFIIEGQDAVAQAIGHFSEVVKDARR